MRAATSLILRSTLARRLGDADDFLFLFAPSIGKASVASWVVASSGVYPASQLQTISPETPRLIRNPSVFGAPHILIDFHGDAVNTRPLAKRRNFLHRGNGPQHEDGYEQSAGEKHGIVLPVESSTVDRLHPDYAECSLLIPSILYHLWRNSLAAQLKSSVLAEVGFTTVDYIIIATNAPSANEATNYQRLEFFGDSVLKLLVSAHLYKAHCYWPEGYLSRGRDQLVSNSRLFRAALEARLDSYIVTEQFTARKWKPRYISDYAKEIGTGKRTLSTKVLADVVEALIGGAFLDGGLERAAACIGRLLPELSGLDACFSTECGRSTPPVNRLLGLTSVLPYRFRDGRLLDEALTHPSCQSHATTVSYQRLEFLGDAVLDAVVVRYLGEHAMSLPHGRMHLIKAATVNAGFLAYLCLDFSIEQEVVDVSSSGSTGSYVFRREQRVQSLNLSHFMRHQCPDIDRVLQDSAGRYELLRSDIKAALLRGSSYPWDLFASLAAEKFFSDIVESVFGAIYLDSGGDLLACETFAQRIGLLGYIQRISGEDVDLRHPKNILGELAGQATVESAADLKDEHSCTVRVGGEDVTSVTGGSSPDEVMTRAAHIAVVC